MPRAIGLLVVAACGGASTPPSNSHAALAQSIDALVAKELETTQAVGISVAVVWHGDTVVAKGYGVADVDHKTPVAADSMFRIGSITKQFAAASILQLAAAHRLSLDDELVHYLPDYPVAGHKVSLRELLTHTSGIRDYEHAPWLEAHMAEKHPVAELVASFAAEPFDFEPGTRWSYSNSGYFLLGQIVELVAKQPFADYVRDHLFAPAGITGVRYCPDEQDYPGAARGYNIDNGKVVPARPILMIYAFTAGAMCATAPGLVAWEKALSHGGVVDDASWRAMTTPVTLAGGGHYDYGFGLFMSKLGDHRVIFHGGGINGFVSTLAYYPDDDLYITVLVNTESGAADELGEAIARTVLNVRRPATQDLPISAAEIAAVVGRYEVIAMKATIAIEADGGKLYVHPEGGDERRRLMLQPDGSYVIADSHSQVIFDREAGRATSFRFIEAGMTFEGRRIAP